MIPLRFLKQIYFLVYSWTQYYKWRRDMMVKNIDVEDFKHQTIGDGIVRGPCPFLNSLANHGYINRDGKNIKVEDLLIACKRTVNLSPSMTMLVSILVSMLVGRYHPTTGQLCLSLDDLCSDYAHIAVEHDASFTRRDHNEGSEAWKLDIDSLERLKQQSKDGMNVKEMELARYRKQLSTIVEKKNPQFTFGIIQKFSAWIESTFIISLLGDGKQVSLDALQSWIGNEEIPDNFKPRKEEHGVAELFAKRFKLMYIGNDMNISLRDLTDLLAPLRANKDAYID